MTEAETSATNFLEELGINSYPIDPFEICRSLDIPIFENSFDGLDGILLFDGKNASIGLNSNQSYFPRKKFSVSHELGHFNLDVDYGKPKSFKCSSKMIEGFNKNDNIELRADQFASELLIPKTLVKSLYNFEEPSWDSIIEVSNSFEVSLMSSAFKYMSLSKIPCCLIVSKDNMIQFYRPSKDFRYGLQMKDSRILSSDSFAYKSARKLDTPQDFNIVPADIWISGRNVTKDSELYEWSLPINSFGQVLTLLWDDDTVLIDDDSDYLGTNNPYDIEEKNYSYDGVDNFPWEPPTLGKKK